MKFNDRNINYGNFRKNNENLIKIITCPDDLKKEEDKLNCKSLIDSQIIKNYAKNHPEKNNLQIFQDLGYPIPINSQLENPSLFPNFFYTKENNNIIPKKNFFYQKSEDFNENNDEDNIWTTQKSTRKSYMVSNNKRTKTSIKKNASKNRKTVLYSEKTQKLTGEEKKLKCFELCMDYYSGLCNNKIPENIFLEEVSCLGLIYYIIKFQYYYSCWKQKSDDKLEILNDSGIHSIEKNFQEYQKIKKIKYIEWLQRNNKICENFYDNSKMDSIDSQFIKDFSQKIRISSNSSNASNKSIGDFVFGNNFGKKSNNSIDLKYGLLLLVKGQLFPTKTDLNILNLMNMTNIIRCDMRQNNNNIKKYYFKFYLGQKLLDHFVELKNDENISYVSSEKFKEIMKPMKSGDEIIIFFYYNPLAYFVNEKAKNTDSQSVYLIDCSNNNPQLEIMFNEFESMQ